MTADALPDTAAEVVTLGSDADWDALAARFPARPARPLLRCLEVARAGGAKCVVIEHGYHDDDYRSEYYALFAQMFPTIPDAAQRLVFLTEDVDEPSLAHIPVGVEAVGYVTIRPHVLGRVGRTVLRPPPELADAITTAVTDRIHLFGQPFDIVGVPFMQQDRQLGRCAQASAWVCHYTAARRHDVHRRPIAEFSLQADYTTAHGRMVPSDGLTVTQLTTLLGDFGLPPIVYKMGEMPAPDKTKPPPLGHDTAAPPGTWDHRAISVACRYLNTGYPVLVGTREHAFVLCGYRRSDDGWITFVRHDDQHGPYRRVADILDDEDPDTGVIYGPWETMVIPVPDDVWLQPEAAETAARDYLPAFGLYAAGDDPAADVIGEAAARGDLTFRTYAISQNEYKRRIGDRADSAPELVRGLRLARLSRIVWVVEAVDRALRGGDQPAVIGEAVYDATSADEDPGVLALWASGRAWLADGPSDFPTSAGPFKTAASFDP